MDAQTVLVVICAIAAIAGGCGMHLNYRSKGGR